MPEPAEHGTQYELFATAPRGIEELLADELRDLGARDVSVRRAGVAFVGDLTLVYRVCLWSRLASRVLLPLHTWEAPTPEALYEGVRAVDWARHLDVDGTFAVEFVSVRSDITHTHYGALKVKDAVVDQFRDTTGRRPSIDTTRPAVRLYVYLGNNSATVSVDFAGESLHKRHYRDPGVQGEAPLKESLAAALLLRAGWPAVARAGGPLVDPLCGSGTLLIEGALMAGDVAPGLLRSYFGFLGWRQHREDLWRGLVDEARLRRRKGEASIPPIFGWDADPRAIRIADDNLRRAGLFGRVVVRRRELAALTRPPGRDAPWARHHESSLRRAPGRSAAAGAAVRAAGRATQLGTSPGGRRPCSPATPSWRTGSVCAPAGTTRSTTGPSPRVSSSSISTGVRRGSDVARRPSPSPRWPRSFRRRPQTSGPPATRPGPRRRARAGPRRRDVRQPPAQEPAPPGALGSAGGGDLLPGLRRRPPRVRGRHRPLRGVGARAGVPGAQDYRPRARRGTAGRRGGRWSPGSWRSIPIGSWSRCGVVSAATSSTAARATRGPWSRWARGDCGSWSI